MLLAERQQYNNMDHCHLRPVDVSAPIICKADFEKHAYVCLVGGDFRLLYNWLIWRVLNLAFFFKKVFSLYSFWGLEQSEQRHLYVDIFLCDLYSGVDGHSPKNAKLKTTPN